MKLLSLALFFTVFLCACKSSNSPDRISEQLINLDSPNDFEILKLDHFCGTPDKTGTLKVYTLELPAFEQMLYFGSDGKGKSGIVPSNRSHMWILDQHFGLLNKPTIKQGNGVYGNNATKEGTFSVFKLQNGKYMAILPLVGEGTMSYVKYQKNKQAELYVSTFGTAQYDGELPVLAYAVGDNIYEASSKVWSKLVSSDLKGINAKLRSQKEYPEYWEYLGWCSWEEYRNNISEELLASSMDKIHASEIPIRWLLIDEGTEWYIDPEKGKNRFKLGLHSFTADPERFPNGLSPLLKHKKEEGIKWMGIWHHQAGLYRGISKDNIMGEEFNKLCQKMPNGRYLVKGEFDAQYAFFEKLFEEPVKLGFDFIKVDFQGPQFLSYVGGDNAVYAHRQTNKALETFGKDNDLGIINCFAQDMLCALNSNHSLVTRASQDYRKGKPTAARIQTYQCYNQKLWMGHVVWGDHDMFHSNDTLASRLMAVSKAMSGAPVYVSDAPEHFVPEVILPLCYSNGQLIRPEAPALPLPESFFLDPINDKKMYRVISPLPNKAASVVCYNIYDKDQNATVKGVLSAKDYKHRSAMLHPYTGEAELPTEGLYLYDYYDKEGTVLKDDYLVSLSGLSDKLFHLCPINKGWALIGLTDKYLSPATVINPQYTKNDVTFELVEGGQFALYLKEGKPKAEGLRFIQKQNNLWLTNIPSDYAKTITIKKTKE